MRISKAYSGTGVDLAAAASIAEFVNIAMQRRMRRPLTSTDLREIEGELVTQVNKSSEPTDLDRNHIKSAQEKRERKQRKRAKR